MRVLRGNGRTDLTKSESQLRLQLKKGERGWSALGQRPPPLQPPRAPGSHHTRNRLEKFPLSAFCNLVEIPSPEALTDWRSVLDTVVLGASWAQMGIPGGVMFCIKNKKSSKLF